MVQLKDHWFTEYQLHWLHMRVQEAMQGAETAGM
jgi:hypothetical protein